MRVNEKYSYSKYRDKEPKPQGSARVFVAPKIKYSRNPIVHFPAKFWGNIFILILLIFAAYFIFYSPFFRIREIIVEGNQLVPTENISGPVKIGGNIFRFSIPEAKTAIINANPLIADLAIYRGIPNALKIIVLERKPMIVWQTGGKYYLVDDAGVVDKEISVTDNPELIRIVDQKNLAIKVGDKIVSPTFIAFIKNINDNFFTTTNIKLSGFQVPETTFDLYVYTEAGFYVKFDSTRPADIQLQNLKNILAAYRDGIHEYIDVRINGWAYYK